MGGSRCPLDASRGVQFSMNGKKSVLITGASGLVGSALIPKLHESGYRVVKLVRKGKSSDSDTLFWDPERAPQNVSEFEGFDAIVNLAGENIASGRWSESKKQRIYDSRVKLTKTLCEILNRLNNPPKVLVNASAIGYYGDRGDSLCTEETPQGAGFLAHVCHDWEEAAMTANQNGIRVVCLRFGMVLSATGGALKSMLLPFKLGLGGALGSGKQYVSWITIDDLIALILFSMENSNLQGTVNAVSPNPVTNYAFTKMLGKVLGRPTFLSVPAFALRAILGEMADEILLSSTRVDPAILKTSGYKFRYPELEGSLNHLLR